MSDFLEDLGKGMASSFGNNVVNGAFGLLGNEIAQNNARSNFKYQWDNYLSPKAQVKNLAAAGLNPAAAMGNQPPVLSSAGLDIPQNPFGGLGTSSLTEISNYLLAKANAKKAGVETKGTELDNIVKERTQEERIKEIALRNKFTEEDTNKVLYEWQKLVGEANILQTESEIKKIDLSKHEQLLNALLRHYADKHNLDKQNFDALQEQLPIIFDKLKAEKDLLEVDASIAKDFKSTMSGLGVIGQGLQILKTLFSIIK